jgi:hypothetical protein
LWKVEQCDRKAFHTLSYTAGSLSWRGVTCDARRLSKKTFHCGQRRAMLCLVNAQPEDDMMVVCDVV